MSTPKVELPVRVGIFETVAGAERAVSGLLQLGFDRKQLSVICSDEHREKLFPGIPHPPIPGENTVGGIVAGAAAGATLGGFALAASAVLTGGASLLVVGPMLVAGGALAGSFTGAMATRGFEPEVADYYDQAVRRGNILVGVESEGDDPARLAAAERVLADAGAKPVPLPEG